MKLIEEMERQLPIPVYPTEDKKHLQVKGFEAGETLGLQGSGRDRQANGSADGLADLRMWTRYLL